MNLKQFKLSNDEEIICEVVETLSVQEPYIVVRKSLQLVCVEDIERNVRYYSFKPWMSFTDDILELQTVNSAHVVAQIQPSASLALHYATALKEIESHTDKKQTLSLDEVLGEIDINNISEEELESYLKEKFDENVEVEIEADSGNHNIITFKPKGTLH